MEGIAKARLLSLFGGERFDWLQVEVVVKMKIIEVLSVDEQIEHVVTLMTDLQANLHPVKLG